MPKILPVAPQTEARAEASVSPKAGAVPAASATLARARGAPTQSRLPVACVTKSASASREGTSLPSLLPTPLLLLLRNERPPSETKPRIQPETDAILVARSEAVRVAEVHARTMHEARLGRAARRREGMVEAA